LKKAIIVKVDNFLSKTDIIFNYWRCLMVSLKIFVEEELIINY